MKITSSELRKIILEEKRKIDNEKRSLMHLSEMCRNLRLEGYSDEEIIDGILFKRSMVMESQRELFEDISVGGFFSEIQDGAVEALKARISQAIIDTFLEAFDVNPDTPLGGMARNVAIQVGENFEYSRWREYFSDGSCPLWTELISQSMAEGIVLEPIMDSILVALGVRDRGSAATPTRPAQIAGPSAGIGGVLGGTLIRSIQEAINEALMGPVSESIAERICQIRARDIIGSLTGIPGIGSIARRFSSADNDPEVYSAIASAT
jgi:hypothetical protein